MNQECIDMLVILLLPSSSKINEQKNRTSNKWLCCHDIFCENNKQKRAIFFRTPFIQFLWTSFITEAPDTITNHCKELLEKEDGKGRYYMLLQDI